jgi:CelD/BcsL family acetyltransferase involved in cellulose biosynthesis
VDVEIVHPSDLGAPEDKKWRDAVEQRGFRSPFLTPTFARIAARHRPGSRVALLSEGAGVTGFLPYERDAERVGLPIGGGMNDVQAIIGSTPDDCRLPEVVRQLGVREWRYDHLLEPEARLAPFREAAHRSPTVDLSRGHADWIETLQRRSSVVSRITRLARQLEREHGSVTLDWHSDRSPDLSLLVDLKSAQYRRTGVRDLFAEPWARRALHEFWRSEEGECAGALATLRAGDRIVAVHLGLVGSRVLHYWFPAYDPQFSKFSPGTVLLFAVAEAAPSHGVDLIDLGMGEHGYKTRVANSGYDVTSGRVPAQGRAFRTAVLVRHPNWLGRRVRGLGGRLGRRQTSAHAGSS